MIKPLNNRQYLGEAYGAHLADWLNRKHHSSRGRRIARTITLMIRFSREPEARFVPRGYLAFFRELGSPSFSALLRLKVYLGTVSRRKRDPREPDLERPRFCLGGRDSGSSAMMAALNLSGLEALDRLRQCVECRKWFFARFAHQRFCPGGNCQRAHWGKSPQGREYHRKKMREYRELQAKRSKRNLLVSKRRDKR
jgi:hypothetical protein